MEAIKTSVFEDFDKRERKETLKKIKSLRTELRYWKQPHIDLEEDPDSNVTDTLTTALDRLNDVEFLIHSMFDKEQ